MSKNLSLPDLIKDSFEGAARMAVPSLPYLLLFAFTSGWLAWSVHILPDDGSGTTIFALIAFVALYVHCLFSVSMYRVLLPIKGSPFAAAWKLSLAWLLIITVVAIILSMLVLFFALIPTALGVVMQQGVEPITAETIADTSPRELLGPVFWPTFLLFLMSIAGLFWFAARVMTFAAATSSKGAIHVFRTWPWTKGLFKTTGPAMFLLIAVPVAASTWAAHLITSALFGAELTALQAAMSGAISMVILGPAAWLGHGLAANVFLSIDSNLLTSQSD